MAQSQARAWWADVQHLRDGYERTDEARRRADEADLAARRAMRERRVVEAEVSSVRSAPRRSPGPPVPRRVSGPEAAPRRVSEAEAAPRRGSGPEAAPHRVSEAEAAPRRGSEPDTRQRFGSRPDPVPRLAFEPDLAPRRGDHTDSRTTGELSAVPRVKGSATPGRRTVEIRGRTVPAPMVPRMVEVDRRRPPRRAIDRVGGRPDRVAMWALLMGLLLILVAIGTADTPAFVALTLR
jgi:hypothetical protein